MRVRPYPTSPLYFGRARDDSGGSTPEPPQAPLPPEPTPTVTYGLPSNASLARGQRITSQSGRGILIHQDDGNVVFYLDGTPLWSTNTYGAATSVFWMQPDGNLVLYAAEGYPNSLWSSGTWQYPGAYLTLSDSGAMIVSRTGLDVLWRMPLSAPPAPTPTPIPPGGVIDQVGQISEELAERLKSAVAIIQLTVGMPPVGNLNDLLAWSRAVRDLRASNPLIAQAFSVIESAFPGQEPSSGFLSAIAHVGHAVVSGVSAVGSTIVRAVGSVAGVVGSAIKFVTGDFPSPADYEPENLCVTAWADPPKFALLSAVAAIVFPPSLLYIGMYAPPNVAGLALGLAEALAKGGTSRVIDKILDPLFEAVSELASTLLDYAFNGNAALVRWALRKIASRLPEGVPQAIILSLAEASDAIVNALKDIRALKSESFFARIGEGMQRVADKLSGELKAYLDSAGSAIRAAAAAISIIIDKGIDGLHEALNVLVTQLLGIPADFMNLTRQAQIEIAKMKILGDGAAPTAILANIVQAARSGISSLAEAASHLPFHLGEVVGTAVGLFDQLIGEVDTFIQNLFALAAEGSAPPIVVDETPIPMPPAIPVDPEHDGGGGGMSALLFAAAGGLGGALVGGPLGGVLGAGAALLFGKDRR